MSRFLRVCTLLIAVCFTTNLFAAGYTCPTDNSTRTYTSCSANYYMSGCGAESTWTSGKTATPAAGNSCISCPSGYSCSGGTACPVKTSITCPAGTYLPANSSTCTTCEAGYYCPANTYSGTSSSNQGLLDCDTGSATVSSSNVWTSATGSSARTQCYRSVTLNKNNMSGSLSLPSNHGCKSISTNSGTTAATVSVYYNTACKLPTTSLSGTATGTNYAGTGSWATSANAASGFVTTITVTDSNAKTYYAGKKYTCSPGYYLKASTNGACTSCATGNYCAGISGKYYSTSDQGLRPCSDLGTGYTSDGGTTATADTSCYLSVSGGHVRSGGSGTTTTQCVAGTHKAAHKAYFGTSYSCSACTGRTKYSGAGAASCSTVSSGYFSTGCNSSGNNCTGQTQCTGATYCSSGIQYNCNSNYQYNTTAGKTSVSQCQTQCEPGYAVLSTNGACTSIQGNSNYMGIYTEAHTVSYGLISDLASCPANYQDKTTGAAGISNCINHCDAGYQVESQYADCTTPTGSWYTPAHDVKYGSTSGSNVKSCNSGYATDSKPSSAWHDNANDCKITCPAGKVVNTSGAACTTPSGSWYSAQHTVSQGSTSGTNKKSCLSNYATPNTTTQSDHNDSTDCTITCDEGSRITAANNTSCTAITSGNVYMQEHTVKQGSVSAEAESCPSGYSISGTTQSDHDQKSDCKISCDAGYAVLSADATCSSIQNSTYKGKYIAQNTVSAGSISSIMPCPESYQDGNGTTTKGLCINSCAAGTQVESQYADCTTPTGSWYTSAHDVYYGSTSGSNVKSCNALAHSITISGDYSSVSPRSGSTACRFTATSKTDSECSSITSNTVSYSGSAWGTNYYTATAKAGSIVTATGKTAAPACAQCTAGKYSAGGSATSCTPADAGYYVGSNGATTQTKCKQGSYTSATGQAVCTPCDAGKTNSSDGSTSCTATCSNSTGVASNGWETPIWNTNNTVSYLCTIKATAGCSANYYKNSNACATCSSGTNSKYTLSAEGTTTVNDCYLNTTATNYVKNVGEGQTTCASGSYCPGSVKVYYGGTASSTRLTTGGSQLCPAGYQDGATGYSQQSQCTMNVAGGKYVNVANESTASGVCAKGTYKAAHTVTYGKTSSCDACTGATYQDATGQSSCKTCPVATTEVDSGLTYTGTYYYNGSDHSTVTNCYTRLKKSTEKGDIQTYCYANSNGVYGYTYCDGFSGTVCNPGYYYDGTRSYTGFANVIKNVCKSVGEDYYYAGGKISGYTAQTRGQCESGLTTCGSGLCANEAADCGRQLHYGDKVVHLRSSKRTTPSLNVKIGDTTFYGNLGAVVSNSLRVKNGTTNYSVVNDNQ